MKQRNIPYGYAMETGAIIIHQQESEIVQRIFRDYLGGASLLTLAQTLTAEKVEFLPGNSGWNKNRVKRILEDGRYTGTDTYPTIIGEDMLRQARAAKDSKNNQPNKSELPSRLPCAAICGCGGKMIHRHDSRQNVPDIWQCPNPGCRAIVKIRHSDLTAEITAILNRMIADPGITKTAAPEPEPPVEVKRLQNEVSRTMNGFGFDRDKAKAEVFRLASEKYRHISDTPYISQILKAEFEKSAPLICLSEDFLRRTVSAVQLTAHCVSLILKNQQIIGKESGHADSYTAPAD
jgi:hypothetical protein